MTLCAVLNLPTMLTYLPPATLKVPLSLIDTLRRVNVSLSPPQSATMTILAILWVSEATLIVIVPESSAASMLESL